MEGVEYSKCTQYKDGRKDVCDKNGKQAVSGIDDDSDVVAWGVVLPGWSDDVYYLFFLFGEGTTGMGFAGGTGAKNLHLYFDCTLLGRDYGAVVCDLLHIEVVFDER
jgi:hypothetical protein